MHAKGTTHVDDGPDLTITPRFDADGCGALGCQRTDGLGLATRPDRGSRVLCPRHRKHYLGVSS